MRELANKYSIPVVDSADALEQNICYNVSRDGHLTMSGFRIVLNGLDKAMNEEDLCSTCSPV